MLKDSPNYGTCKKRVKYIWIIDEGRKERPFQKRAPLLRTQCKHGIDRYPRPGNLEQRKEHDDDADPANDAA